MGTTELISLQFRMFLIMLVGLFFRKKGIIFVCDDSFSYMYKHQVHDLVFRIWKRFPGAEIVLSSTTNGSTFLFNRKNEKKLCRPVQGQLKYIEVLYVAVFNERRYTA